MALYTYEAVDKEGRVFKGEVKAGDRREAITELSSQGLLPTRVEERSAAARAGPSVRSLASFSVWGGLGAVDKILLTRHLSVVLRTGTSLREALDILYEDFRKPLIRRLVAEARTHVEGGEPLSAFFGKHPRYFPPIFVGLVRAGEASGTLDAAFLALHNQLFRDYDLLRRVRMAMIYPTILFVGSVGVIVLMMTFILPRMASAFRDVLSELPWITRFFISVSAVMSARPALTIGIFLSLIIGGFLFYRSAAGKKILFWIFERLPVSSELIKKLALARFCRTFRNLLTSGMGAIDGIEIAATTVVNPTYTASLYGIAKELRRGKGLSESFRGLPHLYPSFFVSIIAIGERTGTLEQSLETLSSFYEEEVDRLLRNLVSLVEPILIFIMGIVVALVALSVLLPVFRSVRLLQH